MLQALISLFAIAFTLYFVSFCLTTASTQMSSAFIGQLSVAQRFRVDFKAWVVWGNLCKWNVFEMIWHSARILIERRTPRGQAIIRGGEEWLDELDKIFKETPGTIITLYTTRLLEFKEFHGFKHDLTWVLPACFEHTLKDTLRHQCPFELTIRQREVAVTLFMEVATTVIGVLQDKDERLKEVFSPDSVDNPATWECYRRLGYGGWSDNQGPNQRIYILPDWKSRNGGNNS